MLRTLKVSACVASVVLAAWACKTVNSSKVSGVELGEKDESSGKSVYIYTTAEKKQVFFLMCPDWKPRERVDIGESPIDIDLIFDAAKLQDPAQAQAELKKLDALIEAYRKSAQGQGQVSGGERIKVPYSKKDCTQSDLYRTPLDYKKYIFQVGNTIGIVDPKKVTAMREQLLDKQFAVKGQVAELIKAKNLMEAGDRNITKEKYDAEVMKMAGKLQEAQELHANIRDLEVKRRTFNEIEANLPEGRDTAIINNLTNDLAYKAMKQPFDDEAKKNEELYKRVARDLRFSYAGQMEYVQGMEACAAKGQVMAGRVEFYYFNRFINGRINVPGWGGDLGGGQQGGGQQGGGQQGGGQQGGGQQGQDQNPVDPTVTPVSGAFWVGTFAYDLSRAMALQAKRHWERAETFPAANPYNPAELSAFANASSFYLPANFDMASEVALQGLDQNQGYNYSWYFDYATGQYQAASLYGAQKHVLCVENKNFDYQDGVTNFVDGKVKEGTKEFLNFKFNWARRSLGAGHASYLYRWASVEYRDGDDWAAIQGNRVWLCKAKMQGFTDAAAKTYNFHSLAYFKENNAEATRRHVYASCEKNNRTLIRGQGFCNLNACTDCVNLLDKAKFPCSKADEDQQQQQQQQGGGQQGGGQQGGGQQGGQGQQGQQGQELDSQF